MPESAINDSIINKRVLHLKAKAVWSWFSAPIKFILVAVAVLLVFKYVLGRVEINNSLILEYLRVLQWPVLVTVIFIFLRPHLPTIVERLIRIGKDGAEFAPPSQPPATPGDQVPTEPQYNISTLDGRKAVMENGDIKWALEKIYRDIFGTQVTILTKLYQNVAGLTEADLQSIYKLHALLMPTTNYMNVRDLMGYLLSRNLVEVDIPSNTYSITDLGKLFYEYLLSENLNNTYKSY